MKPGDYQNAICCITLIK